MMISYILPIRTGETTGAEMAEYLRWLSARVELIVVDGSDAPVFEAHRDRWSAFRLTHVRPDRDLRHFANGKVAGVLTGLRRASHALAIIADDDVRYDEAGLSAMVAALADADVVRPQNYFDPLPWHAVLDTARTLLNRISGGDWPGTIGVRTATLIATRGYDGDVLFENLELVRTVTAAGGVHACPLGLYVRRLAPSARHFWSQRVRQAYDEFARPRRLTAWLAVLPLSIALARLAPAAVAGGAVLIVAAAEMGRRRKAGARVFPFRASLAAPVWAAERAVCVWLAVAAHLVWGGIPYRGQIISRAATPLQVLEQRLKGV
ncbi:MAG: hypothetical protein JWL71_1739 [Acidobacteria bacterium]|nr:hypothetical protein [Acidobacteriota bacterium]